jgi:hypothetical protein
MDYMSALETAWKELVEWVEECNFVPENEESIQCFLYRGIVNNLGTAVGVRSKPTIGKLNAGMHFPDFVLGEPEQVIVEIKFARSNTNILRSCEKDINKLYEYHKGDAVQRVFILFDVKPGCCFLSKREIDSLKTVDPQCRLMIYPDKPGPDKPETNAADRAWNKRRANDALRKATGQRVKKRKKKAKRK